MVRVVSPDETSDETVSSIEDLYHRPGFLIRRAHQIAVSLFLEETAELGITTTQYGVMVILRARSDLDQVGVAGLVGIDRSTAGLVIAKLEEAGYVVREADPRDRRRKILVLTEQGHAVLDALAEPARRAKQRTLSVFTPRQAEMFIDLLDRLVTALNSSARTPIEYPASARDQDAGTRRLHRAVVRGE